MWKIYVKQRLNILIYKYLLEINKRRMNTLIGKWQRYEQKMKRNGNGQETFGKYKYKLKARFSFHCCPSHLQRLEIRSCEDAVRQTLLQTSRGV